MIKIENKTAVPRLAWVLKARTTDKTDKMPGYRACVEVKDGTFTCTDGKWLLQARLPDLNVPNGVYKVSALNKQFILLEDAPDTSFPDYTPVTKTGNHRKYNLFAYGGIGTDDHHRMSELAVKALSLTHTGLRLEFLTHVFGAMIHDSIELYVYETGWTHPVIVKTDTLTAVMCPFNLANRIATPADQLILELFTQACQDVDGFFDHDCISAYESAQSYLLDRKMILSTQCKRS